MAIYPAGAEFGRGQFLSSPLLAELEPDLRALSEFLMSEQPEAESTPYLREKYAQRRVVRNVPSQFETAFAETVALATAVTLELGEGDRDPKEYLGSLVNPFLRNLPRGADMSLAFIDQVAGTVELSRTYTALVDGALGPISRAVEDGPARYEFIKLLAQDPRTIDESEGRSVLMALQSASYLDYIRGDSESSLVGQAAAGFAGGELDQAVAEDFLKTTLAAEPTDKQEAFNQSELKKLVSMLRLAGGMYENEAIARLAGPEFRDQWLYGSRRGLDEYKEQILNNLNRNAEAHRRDFSGLGLTIKDPSEAALTDSIENLWLTLKLATGRPLSPREKMTLVSKRRQRQQAAKTAGETASAAVVELKPQPRALTIVNGQGELLPEEDGQFKDLVTDYLDTHQGQPGLSEDVSNILSYLRRLDLSRGIPRGLKKYKQSVKRGEREFPLFALKPKEAVGLCTASKDAKKIRVLFTLVGDSIGLFGIVDRDMVPRFERTLGIISSAGE